MTALVLDSQALNHLAGREGTPGKKKVLAALTAARDAQKPVLVPAAVLAELYRGSAHNARVDACLGRHSGIEVQETGRALAKRIGGLLAAASLGSEHHVDATVVATASAFGGGVVLTSDPDDLTRIAGALSGLAIHIEPV